MATPPPRPAPPDDVGEQLTLDDGGGYHYYVLVTNDHERERSPDELERWHRAKANVENRIKEEKLGLGLDNLPCRGFHANWAYLLVTLLAYNLLCWLKLLALPERERASYAKRLRFRFIAVARHRRPLRPPPHPPARSRVPAPPRLRRRAPANPDARTSTRLTPTNAPATSPRRRSRRSHHRNRIHPPSSIAPAAHTRTPVAAPPPKPPRTHRRRRPQLLQDPGS